MGFRKELPAIAMIDLRVQRMTNLATPPIISVITATKNVGDTIGDLYDSLKRQSYERFEWIIVDGESKDSTLEHLRRFSTESSWIKLVSEQDCGIYDAINKGIRSATGQYYVVAGADDRFDDQALKHYSDAAERSNADVILAKVVRAGTVIGGFRPRRAWLGHSKAFRGSHSVGMLFRRNLHATYGMYSARFRLLADGYFLKLLLKAKPVRFEDCDFVAGKFAHYGVSSSSKLQTLVETWQIQMMTERFRLIQTLIFFAKVVVRYPSVIRELKATTG
jgi:glycosyltransferase involved in cell wall biosynthesis